MFMRSHYSNPIKDFILDDNKRILWDLVHNYNNRSLEDLQRNAWEKQIEILKEQLSSINEGHIFFEFTIPRMWKRVDNILIVNDLVFIIEFKIWDSKYDNNAIEQVLNYSLDLKNFHEWSHCTKLIPILISTKAPERINKLIKQEDNLYSTLFANEKNLKEVISFCFSEFEGDKIDPIEWSLSRYKPTPTIIEAAQALYRWHNVQEISRSDSGAINLSSTTNCLNEIIDLSKRKNNKSICFVTWVPGAGKTLAGLNIANERKKIAEDEHAVFLSGNWPLVTVLREALTRDKVNASIEYSNKMKKTDAAREMSWFIQNIHHFRDYYLNSKEIPIEKVVVFDEAQRAWTLSQTASFMKRKKGKDDFSMSEPEFLINVMDRHKDWCTIICLIWWGQEINTGEAGLEEWINALKNHFLDWNVYYSDLITNNDNYISDIDLKRFINYNYIEKTELHLSVSVRSFRSEKLSDFVHSFLNLDKETKQFYNDIKGVYPIFVTRSLEVSKQWLKKRVRGSERSWIIASSWWRRLKSKGIDVKNEISVENWFLNDKNDVRSSIFLEDIATEFDIQGLEIDWSCVAWDANLYFDGHKWNYQIFKWTKWQTLNQKITKQYLLNSYRVLLTRARQWMIIYVPNWDTEDSTRLNEYYDSTFQYFKDIWIEELK
ncbi:MAG: hypothetical protein ACD_2C00141G0009 [uncultured bacterium (gcode 4)]|uniref:Schlafen group 3-like DNA/RNA helicase domain-containing protein n=1 Tax=uncultured bacterium (gcode 4) TaxID=1234023 RepID=K2G5P5_9BACT|nr:MAG: hypothetical protein ACD_2C00141G0009 [uncultured bacterium (gcode 4)]